MLTTIHAALEVAKRAAKRAQSMFYIIGTEGHYAVAQHTCAHQSDAFMIVDALGQFFEGPKAKELPINAP